MKPADPPAQLYIGCPRLRTFLSRRAIDASVALVPRCLPEASRRTRRRSSTLGSKARPPPESAIGTDEQGRTRISPVGFPVLGIGLRRTNGGVSPCR